MSRADYAHWNEDTDYVWWMEEGRHVEDEPYEPDDYLPHYDEEPIPHDTLDECVAAGDFNGVRERDRDAFGITDSRKYWHCMHCEEGHLGNWVFVSEDDGMIVASHEA